MKKQSLLLWSIYIVVGLALLITSTSYGQKQTIPVSGSSALQETVKHQTADDYFNQLRVNQLTGMVNPQDEILARNKVQDLILQKNGNALDLTWSEVGPDNFGGRTRAVIFDVSTPTTLYAASVTGGVWKSLSSGSSWVKMTVNGSADQIINVSCLVQAADGTLYAGTGEIFENKYSGTGIVSGVGTGLGGLVGKGLFKSTDRTNFTLVAGTQPTANSTTADWAYINKLAVTSAGRLFVCTNTGLKYSDNGGSTWTTAQSGVQPLNEVAVDVKVGSNGIIVAAVGNKCYISETGDPTAFADRSIGGGGNLPLPTNIGRLEAAIAPSNPNIMYVVAVKTSGALENIYRSADKGQTWTVIGPGGSPTFNIFNSTNNLTAGQGIYDNSIAVFPDNPDVIIVGGVDMWKGTKYDEGFFSWDYACSGFFPEFYPLYVHSNHHVYTFHPTNPNLVLIGTDGGVFMSDNRCLTFQGLNKNYSVTKCNTVSASFNGEVMTGTQNNGTIMIDRKGNTPHSGIKLNTTDGGMNAQSFINPNIMFLTLPNCAVRRSIDKGNNFSNFASSPMSGITGAYVTPIAYWESFNDPYTKDSTEFISFDTILPGQSFVVKSLNGSYPFLHVNNTGSTIFPKDTVLVPDIVQTKFFLGTNGSIWFTKGAMNFTSTPTWFKLINFSMTVQSLGLSKDGDVLYAGTMDGYVLRFKNISSWVSETNNNMETDTIKTFLGRAVTSISVDPQDANHVVVTLGNYGNAVYVYESVNALAASPAFVSKQGNLPAMPVYSSVIEMFGNKRVLLGTEIGVFGTDDISASSPSWSPEISGIGDVSVYQLKQQTLNWWPIVEISDSVSVTNWGVIYAATNGRGVFECTKYVGISDPQQQASKEVPAIAVYPNPVHGIANVSYTVSSNTNVTFDVYDMLGRLVYSQNAGKSVIGTHLWKLDVSNLKAGSYFIRMQAGSETAKTKMVVSE